MQFAWTAPDGDVFPCERWTPAENVRGVLVCVHGMGGAATEFEPLAAMAVAGHFSCYGLNLRGQGNDPLVSRRGHYMDVPEMCAEIAAFTREVASSHPGLPVFLCGESMGALLVSRAVASRHIEVDGVILSAPVVQLRRPTPPPVREALRLLSRFLPSFRFNHSWLVSGKKEKLTVTRDEEHLRRIRSAPHAIGAFSLHFLNALGDLMAASDLAARDLTVPCLVLAAGKDIFLEASQIRSWFDQVASADKSFRLYEQAYHCLWNDFDREMVLADISGWLEAHVALRGEAEA